MRQSEILGLRWADIDWNRNSLVVRKQLQQKCKKGDYSYTLIDPKENKQRRIILAGNGYAYASEAAHQAAASAFSRRTAVEQSV